MALLLRLLPLPSQVSDKGCNKQNNRERFFEEWSLLPPAPPPGSSYLSILLDVHGVLLESGVCIYVSSMELWTAALTTSKMPGGGEQCVATKEKK